MAATVDIVRKTGASPGTPNTITSTNTRASTSDDPNPGTANPIPIPPSGTKYSFWVTTRIKATTTPSGTINNLRWYTDGTDSFGTGVTATAAKASTGADAGYRVATGTVGDTGTQLTQANHTGLDAAPVDPFTFNSGAPKSLVGTISNPSTGEFGDHWVYQLAVAQTATPGTTTQETFTWKYDET